VEFWRTVTLTVHSDAAGARQIPRAPSVAWSATPEAPRPTLNWNSRSALTEVLVKLASGACPVRPNWARRDSTHAEPTTEWRRTGALTTQVGAPGARYTPRLDSVVAAPTPVCTRPWPS